MPELKNVVEGPIYRIMMEYVALIRPGDVILSVDGRSVYNSNMGSKDLGLVTFCSNCLYYAASRLRFAASRL